MEYKLTTGLLDALFPSANQVRVGTGTGSGQWATMPVTLPAGTTGTPIDVPAGHTFTVPSNTQVLYKQPITVEGSVVVQGTGMLIGV